MGQITDCTLCFAEDSAPLKQRVDRFQGGNCNSVLPLVLSIQHGCTQPSRHCIEDRIWYYLWTSSWYWAANLTSFTSSNHYSSFFAARTHNMIISILQIRADTKKVASINKDKSHHIYLTDQVSQLSNTLKDNHAETMLGHFSHIKNQRPLSTEDKPKVCNNLSLLFLLTLHFKHRNCFWSISSSLGYFTQFHVETQGIIHGSKGGGAGAGNDTDTHDTQPKQRKEGRERQKKDKIFSAPECHQCPTKGSASWSGQKQTFGHGLRARNSPSAGHRWKLNT